MVHKGLTQNSAPSCYKASPTQQVQVPNIKKSASILRVTNNLHGCTININTAPSQASTSSQSLLDLSEIDIDKLFAELPEPQ